LEPVSAEYTAAAIDDDDDDDDDAGANSVQSQVASVDAAKNRGITDTTIIRRFPQQHRRHQCQ